MSLSTRSRSGDHPLGVLCALCALCALLVLVAAGCQGGDNHGEAHPRLLDPAVIVIAAPDRFGEPERPPTEFDHAEHVEALGEEESCVSCHAEEDGRLRVTFTAAEGATDIDSLREAFHDGCIGCHEERAGQETGPTACGECLRILPTGHSESRHMRWNLSLHQRHVAAENDRCESCHHEWDSATKRPAHRADHERACSDCHRNQSRIAKLSGQDVSVRSLRDASHEQCVNCHRERGSKSLETGPANCEGCHSASAQKAIAQLDVIPRLKRGQPDNRWIHTKEATSKLVAFNHEGHERVTDRCSSCHHQTLRKCSDCHTLSGSADGGGVTLEQAYHHPSSEHSCVGCHQRRITDDQQCAGCHWAINEIPGEGACQRCHSGPRPALVKLTEPTPPTQAPNGFTLPVASEDFPTTVTIDGLADRFLPSKLPHREIVEALARGQRESAMAFRFHGGEPVPCAGCHHNTPAGERPPACSACHTAEAHPTRDQPGLLAAYHRQCIGCHQQMGLETNCTVCHEAAPAREGSQ